jgi:hypothetical protein
MTLSNTSIGSSTVTATIVLNGSTYQFNSPSPAIQMIQTINNLTNQLTNIENQLAPLCTQANKIA